MEQTSDSSGSSRSSSPQTKRPQRLPERLPSSDDSSSPNGEDRPVKIKPTNAEIEVFQVICETVSERKCENDGSDQSLDDNFMINREKRRGEIVAFS
jgi:hypothetical protein